MAEAAPNIAQAPPDAANAGRHDLPPWLVSDLRSDHAGEMGAVMIYRGILAVSRQPEVIRFAQHHLATEQLHLEQISALIGRRQRTRLLPLWRIMGWLTGALPALFGAASVFATIDAVETFVDRHYQEQISRLDPEGRFATIRKVLVSCQADEVAHRDEARQLAPRRRGALLGLWGIIVAGGSAAAVWAARRI